MKVTVDIDSYIIDAIAHKRALDRAYDWSSDPNLEGDANELYAAAFSEGMEYILNLIKQDD